MGEKGKWLKNTFKIKTAFLSPHNNTKVALRIIIIYEIIWLKYDYHKEWKYSFKLKEMFRFEDLSFQNP